MTGIREQYGQFPDGEFPVEEQEVLPPIVETTQEVPIVDPTVQREQELRDALHQARGQDVLYDYLGAAGGPTADLPQRDLEQFLKTKLLSRNASSANVKHVTDDKRPVHYKDGRAYVWQQDKEVPYDGAIHQVPQMWDKERDAFKANQKSTEPDQYQKALAKKSGESDAEFISSGRESLETGIAQAKGVLADMEADKDSHASKVVAGGAAAIPGIGGLLAPESSDYRARVHALVQQTLRPILGSQFTKEEGDRILEQSYHPLQPEKNLERIRQFIALAEYRLKEGNARIAWRKDGKDIEKYKPSKTPELARKADQFLQSARKPPKAETRIVNGAVYEKVDGGWRPRK